MAKPDKPYRHRTIGNHVLRPETLMMGYGYEPRLSEGSVKCPLFQTSTFVFERAEDGKAFFELAYGLREKGRAEEPGLIYSRINNPDLEILEDRLGLWDGAESTLVFSSGMAAICSPWMMRPVSVRSVCSAGDSAVTVNVSARSPGSSRKSTRIVVLTSTWTFSRTTFLNPVSSASTR